MANHPVGETSCRVNCLISEPSYRRIVLVGELSCRRTVLSVICPISEISRRRTVLSANCLSANCQLSVGNVSLYNQRERIRHALKAEDGLSGGHLDPSERLIIKEVKWNLTYNEQLFSIKIMHNQLKTKAFEDVYDPSPERSGGTYFYTKQLYNTHQLHASLKDPNAKQIYNTGVASVF